MLLRSNTKRQRNYSSRPHNNSNNCTLRGSNKRPVQNQDQLPVQFRDGVSCHSEHGHKNKTKQVHSRKDLNWEGTGDHNLYSNNPYSRSTAHRRKRYSLMNEHRLADTILQRRITDPEQRHHHTRRKWRPSPAVSTWFYYLTRPVTARTAKTLNNEIYSRRRNHDPYIIKSTSPDIITRIHYRKQPVTAGTVTARTTTHRLLELERWGREREGWTLACDRSWSADVEAQLRQKN